VTDQELIGYLDRSFGELSRKVDEKIDGLRDELRRETRAAIEGICSDVKLIAEGVIGQSELSAPRQFETLLKLDEVQASIGPLYQGLNRRVRNLEERAERQIRDVLDVIRERFGKH
jgi:hypothetical protein